MDNLLVKGTGRIQRTFSFPQLDIGEKALARRAYFGGEHLELGDQVTRSEVTEEDLVGLGVIIGALDEDTLEQARGDLRRSVAPHALGARGERDAVRLDVTENKDFLAGFIVADEESRAVVDAAVVGFVRVLAVEAGAVFRDGGGSGWAFGGGEWVLNGTAPMAVGLRAVAVAHAPAFHRQSVDHFNVASAFAVPNGDISPLEQPHVADQADAPFFVGQVWPYHVVEDVLLDGIDG